MKQIFSKLLAGVLFLLVCAAPAHAVIEKKVKVSANDSTAGYLNGKLVCGAGLSCTEGSDGANETLTLAATGGSGTGSVTTIEEDNAQVGGADIVAVDFLGADFDITESPDTEANVVVAAAITRDAEWNTVAKLETATSANLIVSTEIDTIAELNTLSSDNDIATLAGSETLTNKTLAAANNIIDADTAAALAANGGNCAAGEYPLGVDASGAAESCTDATTEISSYAQPLESTLTDIADGTIAENLVNTANPWADAEVANDITIDLAATATALAANGANCAAGEYPLGVNASGAVESCTDATTEIASYAQPLESTLTDIADGTIVENLVNTANPWADNEVADDVTAGNVEGTDFGTLTDTKLCVYDSANTEIDCNSDPSAAAPTAWDAIADAGADGTIALAGWETDFTSSLDAANKAVWTMTNTDADTANDTDFISLAHNDGADANIFYFRAVGDLDGTPQTDYRFSQTAALIRPDLTTTGDITVTGGDITLGTSSIFSGGDTASLNNIDAIDATTETTFEAAVDIAGDITGIGLGSVGITADVVDFVDINFGNTLAGNPALLVDECYLMTTSTGGGFICEGSTANTNEQLYKFPDVDGADTTELIITATQMDTIGELETLAGGGNIILATEIDTSAELRGILGDETGTGAAVFVDGNIGAGSATTAAADNSSTLIGTTAYVQGEINGSGGNYLTCASGSCDVDAEAVTVNLCWSYPASPVATDDNKSIWTNRTGKTLTITDLWCESDQTVTMMPQVDDGTPADMDSVDLACASTPVTDTSLNGDNTVANGDRIDIDTASVSGTPTWATICMTGTLSD